MDRKTRRLALTALFVALILLLGFTPLGMIPLGYINVTTLCIPVVIGAMVLGLRAGLALGFCFGTVSALSAFGIAGTPSSLAATLVGASPLLALVMSYLPRLAVPAVAVGVQALMRRTRGARLAAPVAAAAGSVGLQHGALSGTDAAVLPRSRGWIPPGCWRSSAAPG